jgi:hypothetical protein
MSTQLAIRFFPSSQGLRRGRQTRVYSEIVQQTVRIQAFQITEIRLLGISEYTRQKPDLRNSECLHLRRDELPLELDGLAKRRRLRRQAASWRCTRILGGLRRGRSRLLGRQHSCRECRRKTSAACKPNPALTLGALFLHIYLKTPSSHEIRSRGAALAHLSPAQTSSFGRSDFAERSGRH